MLEVSQEKENYLADFDEFERHVAAKEPVWVRQIRQAAMERFTEMRFPTLRDEEWRFTNIAPILRIPFRSLYKPASGELERSLIEPFTFGGRAESHIVFIDGLYSKELSSRASLPDSVRVVSLAEVLNTDADGIKPHLARHAAHEDNAFTALNTAFLREGALVHIPNGVTVEEPIHLLFISTARAKAAVAHPRNLILLGRASRAIIVESYAGIGHGPSLTNAVTEVVVGEGAGLDHYKIQRESVNGFHIATTQVHQERNSLYASFVLDLGAQIARNNLNILLNAEGSECALNGLYYTTGRQHVDNHTTIDHARPHGVSNELYKGILDERSKAVFNGKIIVRKDAQRTDAHQTNKNLLLSDEAQINTTPQLEILADDVKCTHGATVGQLEEDAIFYLKSRGMGDETARYLLTYAFASDVINRIKPEPIRAHLRALILARLQRPKAKEMI